MPKRTPPENPYRHSRLTNGVQIVLRPLPQMMSASIGVWVRAGGRYELAPIAGISHFIEHMLFKGTTTRSCESLKQAVEGVGGSLNAFTAEEFTCYMAKVPSPYVQRAVTILADMVLRSVFRPRDIDKERDVILEEIRMYEDAPGQFVDDVFNQLVWPDHPLGNLLSGTIDTVKGIKRSNLLRYWRRHYHSRHLLVTCVGRFDAEQLLEHVRRTFGRVAAKPVQRFKPAPRCAGGPRTRLVTKQTEQSHVALGTPSIPRTHPQRFALQLLHVALGANMSSRLFREVREKRGLVYEIGTQIKRYADAGAFVVMAGCDPGKLPETLRVVAAELSRIKRERVSAAELRRAKEFFRGQLLMGLEDTMEHMLMVGEQALMVGPVAPIEQLLRDIDRVEADDIRRVARTLFNAERLYLAAIGRLPAERDLTRHLATV